MSFTPGDPDSVLTLIATFGLLATVLGFFVLMLERLRRQGALEKGLIHVVFLPERRRNFLWLIFLLGFFFVLSGLNESLTFLGVFDVLTEDVLATVAYVGGAVCLLLLIWVGLRPAEIPAERRAELERSSQELIMLAFAPAEVRDSGSPRN